MNSSKETHLMIAVVFIVILCLSVLAACQKDSKLDDPVSAIGVYGCTGFAGVIFVLPDGTTHYQRMTVEKANNLANAFHIAPARRTAIVPTDCQSQEPLPGDSTTS